MSISRLAQSADLMSGMIDRLGKTALATDAPIQDAQAAAIRDMVFRCAACPAPEGCARLQATAMRLDEPPLFCPNRARLMALQDA